MAASAWLYYAHLPMPVPNAELRNVKPYLLSALLLMSSLLQGCAEPPYIDITNEQLQGMLDQGVPLYDIRRPVEWKMTGVIDGSRRLTFVDQSGRLMPDFLGRFTRAVSKDQPVMLICRVGNRSAALARYLMEEHGFTQVYNVEDGIRGWLGDRRPVIRDLRG